MEPLSVILIVAFVGGTVLVVAAIGRGQRRNRAQDEVRTQQWRVEFRAANHGMDPPPGFMPPSALPSMTSRSGAPTAVERRPTNTFAGLAVLFGVLGGLIAIPFGHIALHQIKQTGEEGHTAAVVGLVLGYLWLAGLVALLVALVVAATATG